MAFYYLLPKLLFIPLTLAMAYIFLSVNLPFTKNYIIAGTDGPEHVSLGNQKQSVEYICNQNRDVEYNYDVYVPPVIPHTYDYLFSWYILTKRCHLQQSKQISNLYTLAEADPSHPERLTAWLQRQAGIGKIDKEIRFGGIIVQKRTRIKYE